MAQHISEPLKGGIKGFFATVGREESIIQNVRAIILVQPGERFMRNDIGTPLFNSLWDPADDILLSSLRTFVTANIRRFEPRVEVKNVTPQIEITSDVQVQIWVQVDLVIRVTRQFISVVSGLVRERKAI